MAHFTSQTPSEMVSTHLCRTLLIALGRASARGERPPSAAQWGNCAKHNITTGFNSMLGGDSFVFFSSSLPTSKPQDVLPAYLVPNTCVSCLWEDLERSTDNKSRHLSGQRELQRGKRYLAVGLQKGNKQPAGQEVSKSSEAAASFTPQPLHGPFSSGTAQPWVLCWHLSRMAHRDSRCGQRLGKADSKSIGCPTGLAVQGGRDLHTRIQCENKPRFARICLYWCLP